MLPESKQISSALRKIIANKDLWERYSKNGIMNVRKHYTWQSHTREYATAIRKLTAANQRSNLATAKPSDSVGRRLMKLNHFMITDIDNTLIGTDNTQLGKAGATAESTPGSHGIRGGHRKNRRFSQNDSGKIPHPPSGCDYLFGGQRTFLWQEH